MRQSPVDVNAIREELAGIDRELVRLHELRQRRAKLTDVLRALSELYGLEVEDLLPAAAHSDYPVTKNELLPQHQDMMTIAGITGWMSDQTLDQEPPLLSQMSHGEAILWIMSVFGRSDIGMSAKEIHRELLKHGWSTDADDPYPVIRSTLNRMHRDGVVDRTAHGRYAAQQQFLENWVNNEPASDPRPIRIRSNSRET